MVGMEHLPVIFFSMSKSLVYYLYINTILLYFFDPKNADFSETKRGV